MEKSPPITHYALLIGICFTPKHRRQDCAPPKGSVRDVQAIKQQLTNSSSRVDIRMLTASLIDPDALHPIEDEEHLPTRSNIMSSLEEITLRASTGNFVYVHFSGSGTTIGPTIPYANNYAGELALNVIANDDTTEIQYLRVSELAYQLEKMVTKGLKVTLVLDCCDSWRATSMPLSLVHPDGYAVLTACGPAEIAHELEVHGEYHGALSYFLIRAFVRLGRVGGKLQHIHAYLCARFQQSNVPQRPMLYGNPGLYFFEDEKYGDDAMAIPVINKNGNLMLEAGQAHGVCKGDTFALSSSGLTGRDSSEEKDLVLMEVIQVGALISNLRLLDTTSISLPSGMTATVYTRLALRRYPIRLELYVPCGNVWEMAVQKRQSLDIHYIGKTATSTIFKFRIILLTKRRYEIRNESNQRIPDLPTFYDLDENPDYILDVVEHLATFKLVETLANSSLAESMNPFKESFSVQVIDAARKIFYPGCLQYGPFHAGCSHPECLIEVEDNNELELIVQNKAKQEDRPLYLHLFSLSSGWEINNLLHANFEVIPASFSSQDDEAFKNRTTGERRVRIKMQVPQELKDKGKYRCYDIIKIFLTVQPTSFVSLELPGVGKFVKHRESSKYWDESNKYWTRNFDGLSDDWATLNFRIRTQVRLAESLQKAMVARRSSDSDASSVSSVQSDKEDIFSEDGSVSSMSSIDAFHTAAIVTFAELLANDADFALLCKEAITKIGKDKFVRNQRRLLKTYYLNLLQLAQNDLQWQVTKGLLQKRRNREEIAHRVLASLPMLPTFDVLHTQNNSISTGILENYFQKMGSGAEDNGKPDVSQAPATPPQEVESPDPDDDIHSEGSEYSNDSDTSEDPSTHQMGSKITEVKDFLFNGAPFERYKQRFRQFVRPTEFREALMPSEVLAVTENQFKMRTVTHSHLGQKEPENKAWKEDLLSEIVGNASSSSSVDRSEPLVNGPLRKVSFLTMPQRLYYSALRFLRPREKIGYRRLEWQCDCGIPLYGDFTGESEEINKLEMDLKAYGYVMPQQGTPGAQAVPLESEQHTTSSLDAQIPPTLNTPRAVPASSANTIASSAASGSLANSTLVDLIAASDLSTSTVCIPKYLALCVNISKFRKTLGEIYLSSINKDIPTFRKFKEKYEEYRGFRIKLLRGWLIKPVDIKFIQFAVGHSQRVYAILEPPDCTLCAHKDNQDALIESRKYEPHHRTAALIHPPIPPDAFFHLWECPKVMPEMQAIWINRLPKKLHESLEEACRKQRPGDDAPVLGWGILIIEGLNKSALSWLTLLVIVLSGAISVCYAILARDTSGAFAIGAYMVAVLAALITALYYQWEKE